MKISGKKRNRDLDLHLTNGERQSSHILHQLFGIV
jgi:hypothetical protein